MEEGGSKYLSGQNLSQNGLTLCHLPEVVPLSSLVGVQFCLESILVKNEAVYTNVYVYVFVWVKSSLSHGVLWEDTFREPSTKSQKESPPMNSGNSFPPLPNSLSFCSHEYRFTQLYGTVQRSDLVAIGSGPLLRRRGGAVRRQVFIR